MCRLALGVATVITIAASVDLKAADLPYPPPPVAGFQYDVAPPSAGAPPQVIVVPGPTGSPQYNGAPVPPPVVGSSPYGVAPQVGPRVGVAPPAACPPVWRCEDRGCGWQPGCAPEHPDPGPYGSPGPQIYSGPDAPPAREPYSGPNVPQVYSGPTSPYGGDRSPYRP
jgi:hypothetical protein